MSSEMKKRVDDGRLAPWEEELLQWTENDVQYWNYKDDFKDMKLDEIPRFKTPLLCPQLFIWKKETSGYRLASLNSHAPRLRYLANTTWNRC